MRSGAAVAETTARYSRPRAVLTTTLGGGAEDHGRRRDWRGHDGGSAGRGWRSCDGRGHTHTRLLHNGSDGRRRRNGCEHTHGRGHYRLRNGSDGRRRRSGCGHTHGLCTGRGGRRRRRRNRPGRGVRARVPLVREQSPLAPRRRFACRYTVSCASHGEQVLELFAHTL